LPLPSPISQVGQFIKFFFNLGGEFTKRLENDLFVTLFVASLSKFLRNILTKNYLKYFPPKNLTKFISNCFKTHLRKFCEYEPQFLGHDLLQFKMSVRVFKKVLIFTFFVRGWESNPGSFVFSFILFRFTAETSLSLPI